LAGELRRIRRTGGRGSTQLARSLCIAFYGRMKRTTRIKRKKKRQNPHSTRDGSSSDAKKSRGLKDGGGNFGDFSKVFQRELRRILKKRWFTAGMALFKRGSQRHVEENQVWDSAVSAEKKQETGPGNI